MAQFLLKVFLLPLPLLPFSQPEPNATALPLQSKNNTVSAQSHRVSVGSTKRANVCSYQQASKFPQAKVLFSVTHL